ncbi:hypothetical protein EPUS_05389 [Endocarpon pusillum Z07020]|uniref:Uncharacterized protein n=1 Tax=Endocarpon pusillum (strain Z07020 / HMAS-L-300199) TaxID=1263415 RepID=U1GPS1_ENDPU|nr:uncharacterized protein EPUS_05389 [Endocarpon pusillum Z07020]ERF73966.1 hypothetical protein EPUS_05389 [Endocarpon pusillum Z07020]
MLPEQVDHSPTRSSKSNNNHASSFHKLAVQAKKKAHSITTAPLRELNSQKYLNSLHGILVLESILWILFHTFIPGLTTTDIPCPNYQQILRKIFEVLFWEYSFIASFFLILSARVICIPFLADSSSTNFARSLIRRPIEIGLPLFVAAAVAFLIFNQTGTDTITEFATNYSNPLVQPVYLPPTGLALVNSIYNTLWMVRDFSTQAANRAWPSMTLWSPSLIYSQSYTVYIAMAILPFTRPRWHVQGLGFFILGAWWLNSWGWYSATGLLLADISIHPILKADFQYGFNMTEKFRVRNGFIGGFLAAAGLAMKYVWVAARPDLRNAELKSHPIFYFSDKVSFETFDKSAPYPRNDNYLLIVGILLLVETLEPVKSFLAGNRTLLFFGKRSFSFFTAQSIFVYTIGMKLALHLRTARDLSISSTNAITIFTLIPCILLGAELFYRLVDVPTAFRGRTTRGFWTWILDLHLQSQQHLQSSQTPPSKVQPIGWPRIRSPRTYTACQRENPSLIHGRTYGVTEMRLKNSIRGPSPLRDALRGRYNLLGTSRSWSAAQSDLAQRFLQRESTCGLPCVKIAENSFRLTGKEKLLGPEHTSTLTIVNNLGNIYLKQGKLAEAEQMYQRALAGKEKMLGPSILSR